MVETLLNTVGGITKVVLVLLVMLKSTRSDGLAPPIPAEAPPLNEMTAKLKQFQNCPDFEDGIFSMENIVMDMHNKTTITIDGICKITETIEEDFSMMIEILKCENQHSDDSCNPFMTVVGKDVCKKLPLKEKSYTATLEHILGFDPNCPLKPGVYKIEKAPLHLSSAKSVPVPGYYKAKMIGMHKATTQVCCFLAEMEIKKKKKSKN